MYINNTYDMTLTPPGPPPPQTLNASAQVQQNLTFDQARSANNIYQGAGRICQQKMCGSMTGCESITGCPGNKDWDKIVAFCGPAGNSVYIDGALWVAEPADSQQQMLTSTLEQTGLTTLPNPYNVVGMY